MNHLVSSNLVPVVMREQTDRETRNTKMANVPTLLFIIFNPPQ